MRKEIRLLNSIYKVVGIDVSGGLKMGFILKLMINYRFPEMEMALLGLLPEVNSGLRYGI